MRTSKLVCPISHTKVNNQVSRINATLVMSLLLLFIFTGQITFLAITVVDFAMKVFASKNISPLFIIAESIVKWAKLPEKLIDAAPKVFSHRMGLAFAILASVLFLAGFQISSFGIAVMLLVMAGLHGVFNFCVGCIIYHYLVLPYSK